VIMVSVYKRVIECRGYNLWVKVYVLGLYGFSFIR
jgi:hypothetical protein